MGMGNCVPFGVQITDKRFFSKKYKWDWDIVFTLEGFTSQRSFHNVKYTDGMGKLSSHYRGFTSQRSFYNVKYTNGNGKLSSH